MREIGIDISAQGPKPLSAALGPDVAMVIWLCEEEAYPVVAGTRAEHWPLPDPAGREIGAYRIVRDELHRRIADLHARLGARPTSNPGGDSCPR